MARDFAHKSKFEKVGILFVLQFFKLKSWGKRSAQTAKRFFWGRTKNKKTALRHRSAVFACLLQAKTLVETINTSTGVNQLLLAGIERVALGADFNTDLLLGGAGGEGVAASATDGGLLVLRMDAFFHVVHLFLVS